MLAIILLYFGKSQKQLNFADLRVVHFIFTLFMTYSLYGLRKFTLLISAEKLRAAKMFFGCR